MKSKQIKYEICMQNKCKARVFSLYTKSDVQGARVKDGWSVLEWTSLDSRFITRACFSNLNIQIILLFVYEMLADLDSVDAGIGNDLHRLQNLFSSILVRVWNMMTNCWVPLLLWLLFYAKQHECRARSMQHVAVDVDD